jgi:hypothetical protein
VSTLLDVDLRTRMVLDRVAHEADPEAFAAEVEGEQEAMRAKLEAARKRLPKVRMPADVRLKIRWAAVGIGRRVPACFCRGPQAACCLFFCVCRSLLVVRARSSGPLRRAWCLCASAASCARWWTWTASAATS